MLPLAKLVRSFGHTVTGSDAKVTDMRIRDGFCVYSHAAGNVGKSDLVVASFAIDDNNPEIVAAVTRSVPIVTRAELLGAVMLKYKTRIGVSGSHGKSTTTAIIDKIFYDSGEFPTTVPGATLFDGVNVRVGAEDRIIYEACEYRDSFLRFSPTLAVITSVELDHTDYFHSLDDIFESFLKSTRGADCVIINGDFKGAGELIDKISSRVITYGESVNADYTYSVLYKRADSTGIQILKRGERFIEVETALLGKYNILNILAAVAAADYYGIDPDVISASVSSFFGIERRMSRISQRSGHDIFYDYAHHPTEIAFAINALKERYGGCTVVFCPHTFSRTRDLWSEFISAFCQSDITFLLDIYPAREDPIPGITSENLAKAVGDKCIYANAEDIPRLIDERAVGAVVLMGAGDFGALLDILSK